MPEARWKRGTILLPCHANDETMRFAGYQWKNVFLYRDWRKSWAAMHWPTGLLFKASWRTLEAAKAAVAAIDAECDLSLIPDSGDLPPEHWSLMYATVKKYRQFA